MDSCQLLALFEIEGWLFLFFRARLPVFVYERQQHGPIAVENLAEAKTAFDQIIPGQSTTNELECLGFDPFSNANVRILTYLDVISRFLPNNSIQKTDLPEPVRACLEAKDSCQAYELDLTVTRSKRYGNLFLDIFAFNRKTRETGWNFKALIVLNRGKVAYKLWSGEPNLERYETRKKPLGPLQELDGVVHVPSPY